MHFRSTTLLVFIGTLLVVASPTHAAFIISYTIEGQLALSNNGPDPLGLDGANFTGIYRIESDTLPSSIQSNRTNYFGQATDVIIDGSTGGANGLWQGTNPFIVPFRNPGQNNFLQVTDNLTVAGEDFSAGFLQVHFPTASFFPATGQIPLPFFSKADVDFISGSVEYGDPFLFGDLSVLTLENAMAFSSPVPEPSSIVLAALALVGLFAHGCRRRRA